jgi:hypothetical protein
MAWPKIIEVAGIRVPVDSWAELKEAIQEFGSNLITMGEEGAAAQRQEPNGNSHTSNLAHGDRTLLVQFIEAGERGLLTSQLSQALGKKGKGVRPALERWSRKIGLVTEEGLTAFDAHKRFDGRGFRLTDHYRRTAASMLGVTLP